MKSGFEGSFCVPRLKLLLWLLFAAVVISGIYYFVMKPSDWASYDMSTTTPGIS